MKCFAYCVLVAPAALAAYSCDLLPWSSSIELRVSPTPPSWQAAWGPAHFLVTWRTAGAGSAEPVVVDAGERVTIEVPRTPPVAVRATPVWGDAGCGPALASGETLCCAGAIWPPAESPRARVLDVTFEDGPAAEVIGRLMERGMDVRRFSVERLRKEIRDRLPDDPWGLDVERVTEAVAAGAMRESYVRTRELFPVELIAPPGTWFPRSPFADSVEGGDAWPALPCGLTPFYSADGRRWVVRVDAEGRAWQPVAPTGP